MIPLDEFYSHSERRRRELVGKGHVVTDGDLATEVPPRSRNDVYVFEDPVIDQIVQRLRQGQYKTREIAPELPLNREALDGILSDLRYNRIETLADYKGVVRAAGKDGPANVYTVDPLPFQVRTIDPTLSGHLLVASDAFPEDTPPVQEISSSKGYSEYIDQVEEYWELPESELKTEVDQKSRFASSALGPLPLPDTFPEADSVRGRILDIEPAYVHKQYTPGKVHHGIAFRKSRTRRNPSLPAFQEFASYLADVYRYARLENDRELRELVSQGTDVYFRCLYGNYRAGGSIDWQPFEVEATADDLTESDRRILDILELQPTKNSELAEKWGFDDSSRVSRYLRNDFSRFATRNKDKFICATESARRRGNELIDSGEVEATKCPPAIPTPAKTPIEKPDASSDQSQSGLTSNSREADRSGSSSTSGVAWTCKQESENDTQKDDGSEQSDSSASQGNTNDKVTRLDLLMDLLELDDELSRPPTKSDVLRRSTHDVEDYEQEFGSLKRALDEANISE